MSQAVPRTLGNIFFLHIPKRVEDTLWIGGRELYFDGSYAEHFNKKLGGVVVVEPGVLGDQYLLSRRGSTSGNVPCSDIQDEVKVGDILYVDWSVSEPHNEVNRNNVPDLDLPGIGGVYKASANQVVARVREGELIPYGSYVLCKEVFPDGVQDVRVGEHTLKLRLSKSGLALGSESIPPVPFQGEVVHVGLPLRGQPQRVQPGDRVVFDKRMCGKADGLPLKMKIEGAEYLCIRQDYIEAVLEEATGYVSHNDPSFDEWARGLSDADLEKEYRQASSDWGNSIDSEGREYHGDRRYAFAEILEWRGRKGRMN